MAGWLVCVVCLFITQTPCCLAFLSPAGRGLPQGRLHFRLLACCFTTHGHQSRVCLLMLCCGLIWHACAQAAGAGQRFRVWPALRYLATMRTFWILTLAVGAQPICCSSPRAYPVCLSPQRGPMMQGLFQELIICSPCVR